MIAGAPEPASPEALRGRHPRVGLVDVLRRVQLLGPGEGAVDLVALLHHVPRADAVALDADRHVGSQPHRLARPGRVGRMAVATLHRPLGGRAPVVEGRLADQLDLHIALEAEDGAHQQVVGVVVGRGPRMWRDLVLAAARAHGQRVADQDPARGRVPRGGDGVRPGLVEPRRGHVHARTARAGTRRPRGRAACRRCSASRSSARRANRSRRRAPPVRPCGSSRETRSRRSAGTGMAPPRSGARSRRWACRS